MAPNAIQSVVVQKKEHSAGLSNGGSIAPLRLIQPSEAPPRSFPRPNTRPLPNRACPLCTLERGLLVGVAAAQPCEPELLGLRRASVKAVLIAQSAVARVRKSENYRR